MSADVASPCVKLCKLHAGACRGCSRTLEEIMEWSRASNDRKEEILGEVRKRLAEQA